MSTNSRRLLNHSILLVLTVLLVISTPMSVIATTTLNDTAVITENISLPTEATALSSDSGYTYSAPSEGAFLIKRRTGSIVISDNIPTLQFDDYSVAIPTFDYYRVVNQNGNTRFYQADVTKDPTQVHNFVFIAIYIENSCEYSMHIHYFVNEENVLYSIISSLTEQQFLHFSQTAAELCLGSDDVSDRLKASSRAYTQGVFEDTVANMHNSTTAALRSVSSNEITLNTYDSYTDSDGIIKTYSSQYFGDCYLNDETTITDDPIVNIIPKELCFILGTHIYVGKEYGFFIHVAQDTLFLQDYAVDIMIFDITHVVPSFPSNIEGNSKIEPLFQYRYRATTNPPVEMDPSLTSVVYPHLHYDAPAYFLKDVGFKITLDNPTLLNQSDNGYNALDDEGAFIIQTRVNVSGLGLKKKGNSFAEDTVMFTLGFVPYLGTGLSVLSYVHDVYNGFGNGNYFDTYPEMTQNNEANIDTLHTNSTDQINAYGNLIKSQAISINSNNDAPRLIHVQGGYAQAIYTIARKSGSNYNKIRIAVSISVNVVEDNTYIALGQEMGEIVNYGRSTGTYEIGEYKRLNDITPNGAATVSIPASSQKFIIKITPRISGSYKIFTGGSNGDPDFRIINASKGTTVSAQDDINGSSDRNAVLTIDLIKGDIYYIEAFRHFTPYNYTLRIGYNPSTPIGLNEGIPYSVSTSADSYQMLQFTAGTTGYYEIITSGTTSDTMLFLFDSNGYFITYDDDSGVDRNARLLCDLEMAKTYYIAVQGYNGSPATCTITVSLQN